LIVNGKPAAAATAPKAKEVPKEEALKAHVIA
jgi:hypothetical protein